MARTEANVGVIEGVGRKGEDDVRACLMVPARWDERGSAEINRTSERFRRDFRSEWRNIRGTRRKREGIARNYKLGRSLIFLFLYGSQQ